ncbi:MAG: EscT/YscT/HrcT family type III secretion system export apparatus protein [Chlamydiales bacterium]
MTATSDYLSLILSMPQFPPASVLVFFLLAVMRVAPIVAIAPFLGSKLPNTVKIGLAIALSALFLPHIMLTSHHAAVFDVAFVGLACKELFLGFVIAFMVSIPFFIAQSAGVLIDFLRGSSSLGVTDPTTQTQVTPIGLLYNYVLIVLFFQIGGPFFLFEGVVQSYAVFPADGMIPAAFFNLKHPLWSALLHLLTSLTAISIQLAAPSLISILMAEMFLGIANRLAPQVQIAFLGMSIKSLLGIALLWTGWYFILKQMAKQTLAWLSNLTQILVQMQ